MSIAQRIKEIRLSNDLTQSEMAKRFRVSTQTQRNIEAGSVQPKYNYLSALAKQGVDAEFLLGVKEERLLPIVHLENANLFVDEFLRKHGLDEKVDEEKRVFLAMPLWASRESGGIDADYETRILKSLLDIN